MNRNDATVAELLGLLPDLDELEVLRLRVVSGATPDPGKRWESSSAYATIDKRILSPDGVETALDQAAADLHAYVSLLHEGLRPVFRAFFAGNADASARHLVALGERQESLGRLAAAAKSYRAALTLSLPLHDKSPQILALRRVARVELTIGHLQEALAYYERSCELARDSGDLHAQVVALTGVGNVYLWQGRWNEAERTYHDALQLADELGPGTLGLERGQIYNNLGNLTTRGSRLDEAEVWFESAFRLWETVSSPVDLAICHTNCAHLREAQERWRDAQRSYEAALRLSIPAAMRAVIATDYGAWWLHEGHLSQAEEWGRVAEEHAIAAGSPYSLGHMYLGRGRIARAGGDEDGFTFFEKALEIARIKGYPSLEAETLLDYAGLRSDNGGREEAVAYLERACEILRGLGAQGELARARKALEALQGEPAPSLATAAD